MFVLNKYGCLLPVSIRKLINQYPWVWKNNDVVVVIVIIIIIIILKWWIWIWHTLFPNRILTNNYVITKNEYALKIQLIATLCEWTNHVLRFCILLFTMQYHTGTNKRQVNKQKINKKRHGSLFLLHHFFVYSFIEGFFPWNCTIT